MGKHDISPPWELSWQPEQQIVFSSRDGYVWASWPRTNAAMRLGRSDAVAYMMRDFLAQNDVATRLTVYRRARQPVIKSE